MPQRLHLPAFFALACLLSWGIWAPLWMPALGGPPLPTWIYQHALGGLGPLLAAFVVTALTAGKAGVWRLLLAMTLWRGRLRWLLVAGLVPLILMTLAILMGSALSDGGYPWGLFGHSAEFPAFSPLTFLLFNLVLFGFGEEVGWRGFALPRLQARHSALSATLLLTAAWALWHLPLVLYRPGYVGMGLAGAAGWLFSLATGAILLTWLFNQSRGSLLVVALFHSMVDVAFTSELSTPIAVDLIGAMITVWGVAVLIIAGPRNLSRGERQVSVGFQMQPPVPLE